MEFFVKVGKIFSKYWHQLLMGVGNTMLIALVSTLVGLLIGILVGIYKTLPPARNGFVRVLQKIGDVLLSIYVEVFRSTPMMVQSMVIYWGYAFMSGGDTLPLIPAALFIVSINTGAYISEIVRGGIISIDKGQFEGAQAIGMTHWQTMTKVIVPQVLRNILPAVGNEFVINIKDTSVLNVIGVVELFYQATVISKITWATFETYAVVCVLYFIMTFSITLILRGLEKLLAGKATFDLVEDATKEAN